MGCNFLCNFYEQKFSSSTNFIYFLTKILIFFQIEELNEFKIEETLMGKNLKLKKKLKTQGKTQGAGGFFHT